jgi:hypothetical protein
VCRPRHTHYYRVFPHIMYERERFLLVRLPCKQQLKVIFGKHYNTDIGACFVPFSNTYFCLV